MDPYKNEWKTNEPYNNPSRYDEGDILSVQYTLKELKQYAT